MVEALPNEAFSKVVFIQFNPLVRRLCETVQRYHGCTGTKPRLPLLATIADLLDMLQDQLNWLLSTGADKANISHAVHLISDFLTLPLRSILCRVSTWTIETKIDHDTEEHANAAFQSAVWKCVERASRVLQRVVELSVDLQKDLVRIKSYLAAYAAAVPSHEVADSMISSSVLLDKGEFCLESIYKAAGTIVRLANVKTFNDEMIRLLDIAVTLLEPLNGQKSRIDKSHKVQLLAITFVSTCLDQIQTADDWKKVFPATYASLYRRILQYPLQTKGQQEAKVVTDLSIRCVSKLLRVAFPKRSVGNNSIIEKLKEMSQAANDSSSQTGNEDGFLVKSRKLLPPTLIVLSDLITVKYPTSLKVSFLVLCCVLLVEIDDISESEDYRRKILESVLLHLRDGDDEVVKAANNTLEEYTRTNPNALEFVGPRIIELIESLGAFAKENQRLKLEEALRLVTTYALILEKDRGLRAATRSLFSSETFMKVLRSNFTVLYDVDFNSHSSGGKFVVILDQNVNDVARYRYITNTNEQLVGEAIGAIGRLLGRKRVVLVMDSCVNEMYRSSSSNRRTSARSEQHQIEWLHNWLGCFPFLTKLQSGAFSAGHQYLGKLATAILPILAASSLWSLPTHKLSHGDSQPSSVIHGYAKFTVLMLEFVSGLIQKLDIKPLQPLMPALLPRILEKTRAGNQRNIQAAADHTLVRMAVCLGFQDASEMLVEYMESSFLPHAMGCLRLTEKKSVSGIGCLDSGIISLVELSCAAFDLGSQCKKGTAPSTLLPSVHRFVSSMAKRFDSLGAPFRDDDNISLLFARLFKAAIQLSFQVRKRSHPSVPIHSTFMAEEPWFRLLDPYLVKSEFQEETTPGNRSIHSIEEQQRLLVALKDDTNFIDQMAWRLGYLISHSNLMVQRSAFDCLELSFRYLGWIASLCGELQVEEHNGPGTALLRHIHASWSTIETKMRAATDTVLAPFCGASDMLAKQHKRSSHSGASKSSIPEQRYVLSSLFALVATICELSDDFMVSRWRPSVWPCLKKVFDASIRRFERQSKNVVSILPQESEVKLLKSAIDCIDRVYCHRPTGSAFAGLIPATGSLLFPLLACDDALISDKAFGAIESLILIDGDALYHQLVKLCGGEWSSYEWDRRCDSLATTSTDTTKLKILLARINSQIEQNIG